MQAIPSRSNLRIRTTTWGACAAWLSDQHRCARSPYSWGLLNPSEGIVLFGDSGQRDTAQHPISKAPLATHQSAVASCRQESWTDSTLLNFDSENFLPGLR